jgi:REP element-mobilizing transposase RayT
MDKFLYYYRIPSARANWCEYTLAGYYFITICTAFHERILGEIQSDQIILSRVGKIVLEEWKKSFEIRKELFCNVFVIMPNHIHTILKIDSSVKNFDKMRLCENLDHGSIETYGNVSLEIQNGGIANRPSKSISSFVAGFKSSATKRINEIRATPNLHVWQTRFHDRIIRDKPEYEKIYWYIRNNIRNWREDQYYI